MIKYHLTNTVICLYFGTCFLQTPLSPIYWICEASIFAGGERSGMMEGLTTLNSHIKNTGVHLRFKPVFYISRFFQDTGHLSGGFKKCVSFNRCCV